MTEHGETRAREASCSCGQLRVNINGPVIRVSICHCLACQRRTGSPFGQQARFNAETVEIHGRATEWIRHAEDGGEARIYRFCPECGSTVYYTFEQSPEIVAIPVGAFADPGFPPPTRSVHGSRRHDWIALPDTIRASD